MIVHNFDPVLFDFGVLQIRWYSIAYIFGILFGWIYVNQLIKKRYTLIKTSDFDDLIVYLIFGIVVGGRLGYVIFYNPDYYSENLFEILKIWKGGMSFHGGLLGVIIATSIFSKIKNVNFFNLSDLISCAAPIGIFLGRIANFINGELYGKISSLPWAVVFPNGGHVGRHPSQIYEALLEGLLLFIIINYFVIRKKLLLNKGIISSIFLVWYSILRIFSETFREPDDHLGYFLNYFSMGNILSLITLFFGLVMIYYMKKNEQNN
tara:strand:+ start:87 stop:878 length:792 start_codon:yes stop_codon:yes gene_type:complete